MTRRAFLATLCGVPLTASRASAESLGYGFALAGVLTATDQESEEAYFSLGNDLQITARPQSLFHRHLLALWKKQVCLGITPGECP